MHFGTAHSSIPVGEKAAYAIAFPLPAFPLHQASFSPTSIPLFFPQHRTGFFTRDLPATSPMPIADKLLLFGKKFSGSLSAFGNAHSSIPPHQVLVY